jgi:hypothetical protein
MSLRCWFGRHESRVKSTRDGKIERRCLLCGREFPLLPGDRERARWAAAHETRCRCELVPIPRANGEPS